MVVSFIGEIGFWELLFRSPHLNSCSSSKEKTEPEERNFDILWTLTLDLYYEKGLHGPLEICGSNLHSEQVAQGCIRLSFDYL